MMGGKTKLRKLRNELIMNDKQYMQERSGMKGLQIQILYTVEVHIWLKNRPKPENKNSQRVKQPYRIESERKRKVANLTCGNKRDNIFMFLRKVWYYQQFITYR